MMNAIAEEKLEECSNQTCPCCGHVDRKSRLEEIFQCQSCGHTDNADINAARNILE